MLTILWIALGLIIVLRFLPIRRSLLIEGVFSHIEHGVDFDDKPVIIYYFDNYCRACLEDQKKYEYGGTTECFQSILYSAWKFKSLEPEKGDSVKILGWKNIFGRGLLYRLIETNFGEETYERQMLEYEAEQAEYLRAISLNHAMRDNLSVEEYERRAGIRTKRFLARMEKVEKSDWFGKIHDVESLDSGCSEYIEMDIWQYAETGTLPDLDALDHIKECTECFGYLNKARENYLAVLPKTKCLSNEDIIAVEKTGKLPPHKFKHTKHCYSCLVRFENSRNRHFKGGHGLDCLTPDDCHTIQSTGDVPQVRREHLKHCECCRRKAKTLHNVYIDYLVPIPPLPKRRLESFKGVQNLVT